MPPGTDSSIPPGTDAGSLVPGVDTDGDGLEDVWEDAAGDPSLLSFADSDTDGDGTSDASEDPDGDGLTNLEEYAFARLTSSPPGPGPDPFRVTLLVELDSMSGRAPSDAVLAEVVAAFAALPTPGAPGHTGVDIDLYRDEETIAAFDFDGTFSQRHMFFGGHGPTFTDTGSPPILYDQMIHAAFVTLRTDIPDRGAEVVTDGTGTIENTGILVYYDALDAQNPQCALPTVPPQPDITLAEALAGALIHELGHTLQLGHDTSAGGGVNYFNSMSVPMTCTQAQYRFNGYTNTDATLGAIESLASPRFSNAAEALMDFGFRLSVDTATLLDTDGFEM